VRRRVALPSYLPFPILVVHLFYFDVEDFALALREGRSPKAPHPFFTFIVTVSSSLCFGMATGRSHGSSVGSGGAIEVGVRIDGSDRDDAAALPAPSSTSAAAVAATVTARRRRLHQQQQQQQDLGEGGVAPSTLELRGPSTGDAEDVRGGDDHDGDGDDDGSGQGAVDEAVPSKGTNGQGDSSSDGGAEEDVGDGENCEDDDDDDDDQGDFDLRRLEGEELLERIAQEVRRQIRHEQQAEAVAAAEMQQERQRHQRNAEDRTSQKGAAGRGKAPRDDDATRININNSNGDDAAASSSLENVRRIVREQMLAQLEPPPEQAPPPPTSVDPHDEQQPHHDDDDDVAPRPEVQVGPATASYRGLPSPDRRSFRGLGPHHGAVPASSGPTLQRHVSLPGAYHVAGRSPSVNGMMMPSRMEQLNRSASLDSAYLVNQALANLLSSSSSTTALPTSDFRSHQPQRRGPAATTELLRAVSHLVASDGIYLAEANLVVPDDDNDDDDQQQQHVDVARSTAAMNRSGSSHHNVDDVEAGRVDPSDASLPPSPLQNAVSVAAAAPHPHPSPAALLLVEAKPMADPEKKAAYKCCGSFSRTAAIAAAMTIIVVVAIVAGVVTGLSKSRGAPSDSASSSAPPPTRVPTFMPTAAWEVDFRDNLPKWTLEAIQNDPSSPQARAYRWSTQVDARLSRLDVGLPDDQGALRLARTVQRFALATFYYATGSANSTTSEDGQTVTTAQANWLNPDVSECLWAGCQCEEEESTDNVTNNRTGVGVLSVLNLPQIDLRSSIPREIALLSSLTSLKLHKNLLTGTIPSEIGRLTDLDTLYLYGNQLEGDIPTEFGRMKLLSDVVISNNALSGTIPDEVGHLTRLSNLDLQGNRLKGKIPESVGSLSLLTSLVLSDNGLLNATIPTELGQLTLLESLKFDHNLLTGTIPTQLGLLTLLRGLGLSFNDITGTIPLEVTTLVQLSNLMLFSNRLVGSIPVEIGQWLTDLSVLSLGANNLTGTVPGSLGTLTHLQELDLSFNELSGTIPVELGMPNRTNRDGIENFFFCDNNFVGSVPPDLCGLKERLQFEVWIDCKEVLCDCDCRCSENADDNYYYYDADDS
jgi:Leucine-rich repeat (LRR) protein